MQKKVLNYKISRPIAKYKWMITRRGVGKQCENQTKAAKEFVAKQKFFYKVELKYIQYVYWRNTVAKTYNEQIQWARNAA